MRNDRNNFQQMMPFAGMPANNMMFPNYMNDNCSALDNRINALEKKVKSLENRISRLETPYNNQSYQNQGQYQTTQNNSGYNGEMYMM